MIILIGLEKLAKLQHIQQDPFMITLTDLEGEVSSLLFIFRNRAVSVVKRGNIKQYYIPEYLNSMPVTFSNGR